MIKGEFTARMGLVNSVSEPPNYAALPIVITADDDNFSKGKYSLFTDGMSVCFNEEEALPLPCKRPIRADRRLKYMSNS